MSEASLSPKRARLDYDDSSGKEDHYDKYKNRDRDHDDQSSFSQSKHRKRSDLEEEDGKEEEGKGKTVNIETARREHTLVMRLTNKEQELQDCMNQIQEMKQAQTQNTAQLRSMLLDPAINLVFQRMAKELDDHKEKLKQKQNELSAVKFTPDSQIGKRMMARCRLLLQENNDLGKMISSGRTARLEGEIVLHKALVTEMKKNQKELDEFVGELEEDVEGMQGMIFMLQQQLKEAREQIARLQQENEQLRTLRMPPDPEPGGSLDANSNSNTPLHNWPTDNGPDFESDSAAPRLLCSSAVPSGSDPGNGSVSENLTKRTSPVVPPTLSTSSGRNRIPAVPLDHLTVAQSTKEDFNSGSFAFKVTPDSGVQTQDEEDTSMDTTDFAASLSHHQQPKHPCDSDRQQCHSDLDLTSGTKAELGFSTCKTEIISPQAGAERTSSSLDTTTIAPSKSNSANDVIDGNVETEPSTLQANSSNDSSPNSLHTRNRSPISERTTEIANATTAICMTDRGGNLTQLSEEPMDVGDGNAGRTNCSNQSVKERTSTLPLTESETRERAGQEKYQDENSKAPLHSNLGLSIGIKIEDDKTECQPRLGLVNGSATLPGQGL